MVSDLDAAFGVTAEQFLLADDGSWKFNFLLTKNGRVVGSKAAIDRRARVLADLNIQLPVCSNFRTINGRGVHRGHVANRCGRRVWPANHPATRHQTFRQLLLYE